jgi:signal-transduction protein with cAMP-binding, CBS, and nucleotidyltransferase domain
MSIADIANARVITTRPSTPLAEVAELMARNDVGTVVVQSTDMPVGIITDRDLMLAVVAEGMDPDEHSAADVMTHNLVTVSPDAGVFEVTELMSQASVRRMPLVEEAELVGIVSFDDILRLFAEELENLGGVVEAESPSLHHPKP